MVRRSALPMNLKFVFAIVFVLALLTALLAGSSIVIGISKAMVGVSFILYFLFTLFGGDMGKESGGAHH